MVEDKGYLFLEKTIDFGHPKAPKAFDVDTHFQCQSLRTMRFVVRKEESFILHREPLA